jgi:hypothetical protein
MTSTTNYLDFIDTFQKLDDSFFTQLCEISNPLNEETKQLARELALIQLCALTDMYRVDTTSLLLKTNHNVLKKSKESIAVVKLMELGEWNLIYETIIHGEVEKLTAGAYRNWVNSIKTVQLVPDLAIDFKKVIHLEEVISTRNALIHNKGFVDAEYQRRSNDWYGISKVPMPSIGTRRIIDNDYYKAATRTIMYVVSTIDQEVAKVT